MKRNPEKIKQKRAQKKAEKERKRKEKKKIETIKPVSVRDLHVTKSNAERNNYRSLLDLESVDTDDIESEQGIKQKEFEEPKLEPDISPTNERSENNKKTGEKNYRIKERQTKRKMKWLFRCQEYWIRYYPELIIKVFLVGLVVLILGSLVKFFLESFLNNKKNLELENRFEEQIENIKTLNEETILNKLQDLHDDDVEKINLEIKNQINDRFEKIENQKISN